MNIALTEKAEEYASARAIAGYTAADELLQDLRGDNGEDIRLVASGYVMAVRDSNADYLDGATLLQYLQGKSGDPARLAGMGYVMAVRDDMRSRTGSLAGSPSSDAHAGMQGDADDVRSRLERNPPARGQLALSSVRMALEDTPASAPRRAHAGTFAADFFTWVQAQSSLTKSMTFATLCMATLLVWLTFVSPHPAHSSSLEQMVELSQQASKITTLLLKERRFEKDSFINIADHAQTASYAKKWDNTRVSMASAIGRVSGFDLTESDRRSIGEIDSDFQAYVAGYLHVLSGIQGGTIRSAQEANQRLAQYKGAAHRIESNGAAISTRALERLGKST